MSHANSLEGHITRSVQVRTPQSLRCAKYLPISIPDTS